MQLTWTEDFDDGDNSIWEAASPMGDGPEGEPLDPFYFRLKQRLVANKIEWYEASDPEAMLIEDEPRVWASLEDAKAELQKDDDEIRAEFAKEGTRPA